MKKVDDGRSSIQRLAAEFPDDVMHVVLAKFGVQSLSPEISKVQLNEMKEYFKGDYKPKHLERMTYMDTRGYINEVLMGYWLGIDEYEKWFSRDDFQLWWNKLSTDPNLDLGFWKEVAYTPKNQFQHSTKPDRNKNGIGNILPLVPSQNFVNSSLYRSRFAAAINDSFVNPLGEVPLYKVVETKGKRLSIINPDNLCYLREGVDRSCCTDQENLHIEKNISPLLNGWINSLSENSQENGCLVMREYFEVDVESGLSLNKMSYDVYMLSLGHMEHAAQTYHVHLSLIKKYLELSNLQEIPNFLIWVEAHIIKEGELKNEYVNCHESTGLLPYFKNELAEL